MPKRTKVETRGWADQVRIWLESGKTEAAIAGLLRERDPRGKVTQQDVNRFRKSVLKGVVKTPIDQVAKAWTQDAADAYDAIQRALNAATAREGSWDRDQRESFLT